MDGIFCGNGHLVRVGVRARSVLRRADTVSGLLGWMNRHLRGKVGGKLGELRFALSLLLPSDGGCRAVVCRERNLAIDADRLSGAFEGEKGRFIYRYSNGVGVPLRALLGIDA